MSFKVKSYEEKLYGIINIIPFGKYKGYSVGNLLQKDPNYLLWADNNRIIKLTLRTRQLALENAGYILQVAECDATEIDIY